MLSVVPQGGCLTAGSISAGVMKHNNVMKLGRRENSFLILLSEKNGSSVNLNGIWRHILNKVICDIGAEEVVEGSSAYRAEFNLLERCSMGLRFISFCNGSLFLPSPTRLHKTRQSRAEVLMKAPCKSSHSSSI